MNTAVQLRKDEHVVCALFHGEPRSVLHDALGPVAVFEPDRVVGYRIAVRRRVRAFVFRTLVVDDRWAACIPGVRPRVRLLIEVRTASRARRLAGLLGDLAKGGAAPSALSDAFYLRLGQALSHGDPSSEALQRWLRLERPWGDAADRGAVLERATR